MKHQSEFFFNKGNKKIMPILSLSKETESKNNIYKSSYSNTFTDFNNISVPSKAYNNMKKGNNPYFAYLLKTNQLNNNKKKENSEAKLKKTFFNNMQLSDIYPNSSINKFTQKKSDLGGNSGVFNFDSSSKRFQFGSFYNKKRKINLKYNTILKKFEGDFYNFYVNSLTKTKDEFLSQIEKLNKTYYKISPPSTVEKLKLINTKNMNVNKKATKEKKFPSNENYLLSSEGEDSYSSMDKNEDGNALMKKKYSSQFLKLNKFAKYHKRKRNFRQYMTQENIYENKWKTKINFIVHHISYNPILLKDIHFQSGIITDELCLLLDDIQHFRFIFYEKPELISAVKNKDLNYQIKLNKIVEESCALLHMIPKIILKEYYNYTDRYISISDPSKELFSKKIVYNEVESFQENLRYLYKILNFVNCCNEVYIQLIAEIRDEMLISLEDFRLLKALFEKLRHHMINLTNICKNILKDYLFDKIIIENFKYRITKSKEKKEKIKQQQKEISNKLNTNTFNKNQVKIKKEKVEQTEDNKDAKDNANNELEQDITSNEYAFKKVLNKLKTEQNFLTSKLARISKALENNKANENKYSKNKMKKAAAAAVKERQLILPTSCSGPMSLINSPLMTKMLKYIKKDFKQKIISLRTSERILNKSNG